MPDFATQHQPNTQHPTPNMSNTPTVSFRLPSKYVVFLDALAHDHKLSRSQVLIRLLDACLEQYLKSSNGIQHVLNPKN